MGLSAEQLRGLEAQFRTDVVRIVHQASVSVERRLRAELTQINIDGLHGREAKIRLANAFDAVGIVPGNSFTLEAIYRTQTMLAYGAGKANVESNPAIDEILWGYKYVTVGDDRVRPSHAAIDGVTLPKGHAFWEANYPPNGWACRCQAIPLFEEVPIVLPEAPRDGVEPGADAGFRFRPDRLFGPMISALTG